jgi:hypothetical protein
MMRKAYLSIALFFVSLTAYGQTVPYHGVCTQGATSAVVQGLQSTNKLLSTFPSCTVTVYLTGTSTLATLYSDANNTPLSNPFTAASNGLIVFFSSHSSAYDIRMTATGMTTTTLQNVVLAGTSGNGILSVVGTSPITAATAAGIATVAVVGITDRYNINGIIYAYSNGVLQSAGNPYSASITSCSQCNATYEAGFTTTNPMTFGFVYAYGTTASATLGDGTNTVTLTTPFTSGSLPYSYCTVGEGVSAFTFTLSATSTSPVQASNPTAGVNCLPRSYVGTGTGGHATGVTVIGTSAALVGATGTLTNGGLETSNVGQTFTVTTSGTQYVYLLLVSNVSNPTGGSFTTPGPTVFQMNAPTTITVAGQYGGTWTGYLYRSVNSFVSGTTNPILVGN